MKPVIIIKEKIKRGMARRAIGALLSAGMACNMLWAEGLTVFASEQPPFVGPTEGEQNLVDIFRNPKLQDSMAPGLDLLVPEGNPAPDGNTGEVYSPRAASQDDLECGSANAGDLAADGYQWDAAGKILRLRNAAVSGTVTLPDDTVTVETEGNCFIGTVAIAGGSPQKTNLTFSGTGQLTIENHISISGNNNCTLTVAAGAHLVANDGISMGASGGTDSTVTVKGTLTVKGAAGGNAVYVGMVVVGAGGLLEVSGENGVLLNGRSTGIFANVFIVERGGCFAANCGVYNIMVQASGGNFPSGSNADQAFNVPEGYLPEDCRVEVNPANGTVNLVRISTGQVYSGPLMIHENHIWSEEWKKDVNNHWKECTYAGCDKKKEYGAHSYDNDTGKCICGSTLAVTLDNGEGLVYNGQEQKPGVAVTLDGTALDASKYSISYSNNINAGQASVTIAGKDGYTFKRTVAFGIAKAKPTVSWSIVEQTVSYSSGQTAIIPPVVTLVNGEKFDGKIAYSYAAEGSASYTPGLPTKAGVYTVRASIPEQGNYAAADSTNTLRLTVERSGSAGDITSGGTAADGGNKSPKTGQPSSPWKAAGAGALAVLFGAGGFLAVRRKKEGNN